MIKEGKEDLECDCSVRSINQLELSGEDNSCREFWKQKLFSQLWGKRREIVLWTNLRNCNILAIKFEEVHSIKIWTVHLEGKNDLLRLKITEMIFLGQRI